MKYVPVKIVHYTELKRGDLVSYFLPMICSSKEWSFIYKCCMESSVLKYIEINNGVISYEIIKDAHQHQSELLETNFDKDRHQLVLMEIDGTNIGGGIEKENSEPNSSSGLQHLTLNTN